MTNARPNSCEPVNTSKLGETAATAFADARAEERREDQAAPSEAVGQEAHHEGDEDTGTAIASVRPRSWSDLWKCA